MDTNTAVIWAIVIVCVVVCLIALRSVKQEATLPPEKFALRDSAAVALSSYWSHYYEGWSLVLFRDPSGVVRHVACGIPDGRYFDAGGYCNEDKIAERLGIRVTAENCDEPYLQSLLGTNNAVLQAAEELRHNVERKAPLGRARPDA
jgi:hypothetical protein